MVDNYLINQPTDATVLSVPTDILCSFHYFGDVDMAKIRSWGTRIIGDSGAFSAMSLGKPIDRETFHQWAKRWEKDLFWVAALDMIGDPEGTYRNWIASKRDGLSLVPTIHYGEGTKQLDRFAEQGATLIGLGGMVPYGSEKERLMRWCLSMFRHARDNHPQVRFHGWGITHAYLVDNLPWWSTDSSGFSSAFRFGVLKLWVPERARFVTVKLNGKDLAKYARLVRDVYGTDWKVVASSLPENRRELGRVALKAVQLYGEWLRTRQRVSAPILLQEKQNGPLQVAAMGAPSMQPIKAIHPESEAPDMAGPLQAAAMIPAAQGQAISPNGLSITVEAPIAETGPLVSAAVGSSGETRYFDPQDIGNPK